MNIVISAFYSEVGIQAISLLSDFVKDIGSIKDVLNVNASWTDEHFSNATKNIKQLSYDMHSNNGDLECLKRFLVEKRPFILSMFENTNLMEHDAFTDMLWAVFHVSDELEGRDSLASLPYTDLDHLSVDLKRAYGLLLIQWLYYMNHLKKEYPFLFSLAVRKSPFNEKGSVIIS